MIEHSIRPPGHVTDNLRELRTWQSRRAAKDLDNRALDTAIAYLEEYRSLIAYASELRRIGHNEFLHRITRGSITHENISPMVGCDADCPACLIMRGPTPIT